MTLDIDQQLERIARGTSEIVPLAELRSKLQRSIRDGKPLQIKLGLDPTAPNIHLGHAIVLKKLRLFQDLGHQVTVIIGDFTAMIGDPTGRSEARKQLTPEEVAVNAKTYADQYCKILDADRTRVAFNSEWLGKLKLNDIVNLLAKTTVARILERDDFDNRFKGGIPIYTHELLYPICQAYDSVELRSDVELGGTEQRFNIMMGRDLQREFGIEPQVALFMPLLVGLDGVDKMSKSKGNDIGIDEKPSDMFGKIMSISDEMMPTFFELCTEVPLDEVAILTDSEKTHPKQAKKRLAREIITIYHSAKAAQEADDEFERVHGSSRGSHIEAPADTPDFVVAGDLLGEDGSARVLGIVSAVGFAKTNSEAKRLIQEGGVSIDGRKINEVGETIVVTPGMILKVGKNRFARLFPPQ